MLHMARALACGAALLAVGTACSPEPPKSTTEVISDSFEIDRVYLSMRGPVRQQGFRISKEPGELVWLTGVQMEAIDEAGEPLGSQENLCHAQLKTAYPAAEWRRRNRELFGGTRVLQPKWFTLVQGTFRIELPRGTGIPIYSDEPVAASIMALNLDPDREPFEMRVRTRLEYVADDELRAPMKALAKTGVNAIVKAPGGISHDRHDAESCALDEDDLGAAHEDHASHEPGQAVEGGHAGHAHREHAAGPAPGGEAHAQGDDEASAHFFVPPGRHVYSNLFKLGGIHENEKRVIRAHYISAHLHVYGESIELRNATEDRSVFKSVVTENERHTGIVSMTHFASSEGIPLDRTHDYELITIYDNTTDREVDAMGIVYIYYENSLFQHPGGV